MLSVYREPLTGLRDMVRSVPFLDLKINAGADGLPSDQILLLLFGIRQVSSRLVRVR